jgi:hypothetical protein
MKPTAFFQDSIVGTLQADVSGSFMLRECAVEDSPAQRTPLPIVFALGFATLVTLLWSGFLVWTGANWFISLLLHVSGWA